MGTSFPFLKCLRSHNRRHCGHFSCPKYTSLQNVAYIVSTIFEWEIPSDPHISTHISAWTHTDFHLAWNRPFPETDYIYRPCPRNSFHFSTVDLNGKPPKPNFLAAPLSENMAQDDVAWCTHKTVADVVVDHAEMSYILWSWALLIDRGDRVIYTPTVG